MIQREIFICIGDLIPEDDELGITSPKTKQDDWTITTAIQCSKVLVTLEGSVDYTDIDPRMVRDLAVRQAQYTAHMWLSVIGFVEGASYSTRISTIEDSTGCIRELGPKPRFWPDGEDLGIENAQAFAGATAALFTNDHFRRALYDYVTALNFIPDSPFFLYRALDTLRKHFADDWDKMNQSLGTEKSKTEELLKLHADQIRHGELLDQQQLFDAYRGHYKASKYVRNALLTFLLKNSESALSSQLPDLDVP